MFRFLLIISLLLTSTVFGQGQRASQKTIEFRGFGGLNTLDNIFGIEKNEATRAHNIDFGRKRGSLTKRWGFDSLGVLSGVDSIIAIFAAYKSDGTQQLIYLVDPKDGTTPDSSGWGEIWASVDGGFSGGFIDSVWILIDTTPAASVDIHLVRLTIGNTFCTKQIITDGTPTAAVIIDSLVLKFDSTGCVASPGLSVSNSGDTALLAVGTVNIDLRSSRYVKDGINKADELIYLKTQITQSDVYFTKFPIQSEPSFAMFNDDIYITSPDGRGAVIHEGNGREFPFRAPGELRVIPLVDTFDIDVDSIYGLDGEYRYKIYTWLSDSNQVGDTVQIAGYVHQPVKIKDGKMFLTGFTKLHGDSTTKLSGSVSSKIDIYRTRANIGRLDFNDSVYFVTRLNVPYDDSWDTLYFIDSIPDSLLGDGLLAIDEQRIGLDSAVADSTTSYPYGGPSFLAIDSLHKHTPTKDSTNNYGIFYGIPGQRDTLGMAYMLTYIDTVTGIESDSGRSLYVYNHIKDTTDATDTILPWSIKIGIPNQPAATIGLVRNLYRGMIYQVTFDTGAFNRIVVNIGEDRTKTLIIDGGGWVERLAVDTVIVTDYFLLAQIPSADSFYVDSVRWDSLTVKRRFVGNSAPPGLKSLFTHDGHMFGINKSKLYFSKLDSAFAWGVFDFTSLNKDDGDENTLAFPTQGGIVVCKNNRTFIVFQNSNLKWSRREITGLPGCIAPRSYAKGLNGHYYLSAFGVVRLNDGQTLERRYSSGIISEKLSNFDNLSSIVKRDARAAYLPNSQQYLLNIGDTTYVYDERLDAWSTWSLKFAGSTLYGSEDELQYIPGDTMYFIQQGDSTIYRYGTSELDNGSGVQVLWSSAPFGVDNRLEKVSDIAVWWTNVDGISVVMGIYNEADSLLENVTFSSQNRYSRKSYDANNALYHRLFISGVSIDSLSIDGIDITIVDQGIREIE